MIKDKNGNVIEIGDIVKIENSPIKNDNAVYVVEQDGTSKLYSGSDLTLYRVAMHKGGYTLSKSSNSICFYPLVNFSNRYKFTREEMQKATIVILAKNNPKAFELKKANNAYESEENTWENYYIAVLEVNGEQIKDTSYSCDQSEKLISFFSNLNFKQGEELTIRKINRTWGYWYQREPVEYVLFEGEKSKTTESVEVTLMNFEYNINKDTDTRNGNTIFVLKITTTLDKDQFKEVKVKMGQLGGFYSRFKSGFIFQNNPAELIQNIF